MASETQEIVPANETNDELVSSEKKVEYSVKSEVISTVKTHETVTYVTEVKSETVENHVQESTVETTEQVTIVENGDNEEKKEEEKDEVVAEVVAEGEPEQPKENGEQVEESEVPEESKVEANVELNVEAAPAEASANDEAAEPSPEIEEEPPKVILHQLPPVKEIVSRSPHCLALETLIKMSGIPYENEYEEKAQDVTKENKGKIPYIVYKKQKVEGLKNCIDFLKKELEITADKNLSSTDESVAHAFRIMVEESTNWSLVYYRWVDNYGESKKMFSKLPPVLNVVSPKMFQNKCKKSIESHVIGRYNREELYNIAEQDLKALAAFLGEKPYFFGEEPSTFDAVAFGLLANFDYGTVGSPQQSLIREKLTNLHDFNERMKERYWSDWEDICGAEKFVDKPKASLVKRLSFRGNKKSKKPKEEGEKSEPTSPTEEAKDPGEAKENGEHQENGEESPEQKGETETPDEEKDQGETKDQKEEDEKDKEAAEKDESEEKKDDGEKPEETAKEGEESKE